MTRVGLVWCVLAGLLLVVGIPLSFILIGIPLVIVSKLMYGLGAIWFGVRCILGLITLSRGDPYPRPHAVLA